MSDDRWEPLDRLATSAPPPPPGLADAVVARARIRRRGAAAVLASTATVLAVIVGAVVWDDPSEGTATPQVGTTSSTPPEASSEPTRPAAPRPSPRLAMVAAAVEDTLRELVRTPREILVSDRLCADSSALIYGREDDDCRPWGDRSRERLAALLLDVAPVRFVPDDFSAIASRRPLVSLATLRMASPRRGSVYVFAINGGLSCTGSEKVLERSATGWKVVPGSGPRSMVVC